MILQICSFWLVRQASRSSLPRFIRIKISTFATILCSNRRFALYHFSGRFLMIMYLKYFNCFVVFWIGRLSLYSEIFQKNITWYKTSLKAPWRLWGHLWISSIFCIWNHIFSIWITSTSFHYLETPFPWKIFEPFSLWVIDLKFPNLF